MADTIELEIVTPERLVVRDVVTEVQIPGKNGYLGILPGHAPLITELSVGEISYGINKIIHYLAVAWGFAEVLPNKVTVLAERAERAEDIDVSRAQEALKRAEERLQNPSPDLDYPRALAALARARSRLEVAQKRQPARASA
jgi:F-type H+-transporting ATPase subunit epsilon